VTDYLETAASLEKIGGFPRKSSTTTLGKKKERGESKKNSPKLGRAGKRFPQRRFSRGSGKIFGR